MTVTHLHIDFVEKCLNDSHSHKWCDYHLKLLDLRNYLLYKSKSGGELPEAEFYSKVDKIVDGIKSLRSDSHQELAETIILYKSQLKNNLRKVKINKVLNGR